MKDDVQSIRSRLILGLLGLANLMKALINLGDLLYLRVMNESSQTLTFP